MKSQEQTQNSLIILHEANKNHSPFFLFMTQRPQQEEKSQYPEARTKQNKTPHTPKKE